jgi:hypothetical protein
MEDTMRSIHVGALWPEVAPELERLLHPAAAFDHPQDVLKDEDLTLPEKRAILSSWASDACAVDSRPSLRLALGAKRPVTFDDVVDALQRLDSGARPKWKRVLQRRSRSGDNQDGGISLA